MAVGYVASRVDFLMSGGNGLDGAKSDTAGAETWAANFSDVDRILEKARLRKERLRNDSMVDGDVESLLGSLSGSIGRAWRGSWGRVKAGGVKWAGRRALHRGVGRERA